MPDEEALPRIDDEGLHLPADLRADLALEIAGRRVWVVVPDHDGRRVAGGIRLVPWPLLLTPYLDGVGRFRLVEVATGDVLYDSEVRLGSGEGVVDLRDEHGRALSVDKSQQLGRMFADVGDDFRGALVDSVAQALELMRDHGHDAFLAYGPLLGAVRDGRLIGHDDDVDVAFLARSSHPVGVMLESFALQRLFAVAGWRSIRMSAGTFKLLPPIEEGTRVGLDVFAAFYFDDTLHIMAAVAAELPREALIPTSTVVLEGRELPAPADPPRVLEAIYGEGWRVPDPAFHYDPPQWLRRRLNGLMRGERKFEPYWQAFYSTRSDLPTEPSSFARWVAGQPARPGSLLDVGCGHGRDTAWFAEQGVQALGCDYSRRALELAEQFGSPAEFRPLNLYALREVLTAGALFARDPQLDAVYARHLVEVLEEQGRLNLWRLARSALRGKRGRLFLEIGREPLEGPLARLRSEELSMDQVCRELVDHGFDLELVEDDDPRACRVIAGMGG